MMLERKRDRCCIVGFAFSRNEAPYTDDSFEWMLVNDVYRYVPAPAGPAMVFEMHQPSVLEKDWKEHFTWLQQNTTIPVLMWRHEDRFPASVAYPMDEIRSEYGDYFTNTISYQLALAMAMGYAEIHLYGVDMAQGGPGPNEYAAQRPSCEYFVGMAMGKGIKIVIPKSSDLCKCSELYGQYDESPLRLKLDSRETELAGRRAEAWNQKSLLEQNLAQLVGMINQLDGALEDVRYIKGVWTQPMSTVNEAVRTATLPAPAATPSDNQPAALVPGRVENVQLVEAPQGG